MQESTPFSHTMNSEKRPIFAQIEFRKAPHFRELVRQSANFGFCLLGRFSMILASSRAKSWN